MNRALALTLGAVLAGFAFGFIFGARVREELPGATDTRFTDGKVIVSLDVSRAARSALGSLL